MGKEWLLLPVSIPFLVLLAYGYNVLSSYFRYKAKTSTVPFNVKMEDTLVGQEWLRCCLY